MTSKTLDELIASGGTTTASQIRQRHDKIEQAIQAGAKYEDIIKALELEGITISKRYLATLLTRERKKRRSQQSIPPRSSPKKHSPEQTTIEGEEGAADDTELTEKERKRRRTLAALDALPKDYEGLKRLAEKRKREKQARQKEQI